MKLTPITLCFADIAGISPLNARPHDASDVSELAASILAVGLLQPLLVRGSVIGYQVLDGGRRTRALALAVEQGFAPTQTFDAVLFEGTDAEAAEASLIAVTMRKPLHPVQEFEAFVALENLGHDAERIARDFGTTKKHVRQRLALGRLAAPIRAAWAEGKITAEVAQAYCCGDIAAQLALWDPENWSTLNAHNVRRTLRNEATRATADEAIYVTMEAYVAAGGRVDEDLFGEDTWLLDGALLQRLANEKMRAEAEAIKADEGWGWIKTTADLESENREWVDYECAVRPCFTEGELALIGPLEQAIDDAESDADIPACEQQLAEIEARAILRAIAKKDRKQLGLIIGIEFAAGLKIDRAMRLRNDVVQDDGAEAAPRTPGTTALPQEAPLPATALPPKAVQNILDETLNTALSESIRTRPDIALLLATATMAAETYGGKPVRMSQTVYAEASTRTLTKSIARMDWAEALAQLTTTDHADIVPCFADCMAQQINVSGHRQSDIAALCRAVNASADLAGSLIKHFDAEAYFKAAPRDIAIDAIRDNEGDAAANDCGKMKKDALAQRAATSTKAKSWLPAQLKALASQPEPTIAQAMAQALNGDADPAAQESVSDSDRLKDFIGECCDTGKGLAVKSTELRAAFNAFSSPHLAPLDTIAFASAMKAEGFEKTRDAQGTTYHRIAIRDFTKTFCNEVTAEISAKVAATDSASRIHGKNPGINVGKKRAGRLLDGIEHNGYPEVKS